jgi:hypothetical protein
MQWRVQELLAVRVHFGIAPGVGMPLPPVLHAHTDFEHHSKRSRYLRQRQGPIFGMVGRRNARLETGSKAAVVALGCQSVHPLPHSVRARSHGCCSTGWIPVVS